MDGFLGIDVGTTNSKAVLLGENGDILSIWKQETPQVLRVVVLILILRK